MVGIKIQKWFERRSILESIIIISIFILGGISSLTDQYGQKSFGIFTATGIIFLLLNSGIGYLMVKLFYGNIKPIIRIFNSNIRTKYLIALILSILLNILFLST